MSKKIQKQTKKTHQILTNPKLFNACNQNSKLNNQTKHKKFI